MGTHNHRGLSDTGMRGESVTTLFITSPSKTASRPSSRCPKGTKKDPPDKCLEGQAEPVGLEPTHPHGRQFSRLVQYQLCDGSKRRNTVGAPGFEPGTSASRTQRSTELSHAPNFARHRPKKRSRGNAWARSCKKRSHSQRMGWDGPPVAFGDPRSSRRSPLRPQSESHPDASARTHSFQRMGWDSNPRGY